MVDSEHFYENQDPVQHPPVYEQVLLHRDHHMQLQEVYHGNNSSVNETINMTECPAYQVLHH